MINPIFVMFWLGVGVIAYSFGGLRAAGVAILVGALLAGVASIAGDYADKKR